MVKRFYLDTCIWRDYLEDRHDGVLPLGEFAFQFLRQCKQKKAVICYSKITLFELTNHGFDFEKIREEFGKNMIEINHTQKQVEEAQKIASQRSIPLNDVFHAILARDNQAGLITRDYHFQTLNDIARWRKPEEVIWDLE